MSLDSHSIGIAIITHNSKSHLPSCLPPLLNSPLKPKILLVNSSSGDGTVELAKKMGVDTLIIPRENYNHGLTREQARKHLNTDIIVMMTPDAYLTNSSSLSALITPLIEVRASIAYAKQIPHKNATYMEQFSRTFNYPEHSQIRSYQDSHKWGIYTIFCSNSCAAYLNSALDEINGFPEVLIGEDTFAAAKLLKRGHKIAYVSEAIVHHSHSYSLLEEFRRSFDTGLARKEKQGLIDSFGKDSQRGKLYVKSLLSNLSQDKPSLIPYALTHTLVKWLGYKIGRKCVNAPTALKRALSAQDFYWK